LRNPDPATRRYTSLAWAAVLGHEETFEYLLASGHDDEELSRDSENNTIFMLLADQQLPTSHSDAAAAVRMARMYYDRYAEAEPEILDWSNAHGRTALHIASLKGNEDLVRLLCDLGADFDLADNQGNTPLHYASSWNHIPIVQLLIERGCQYTTRNNENCSASDYAYSFSTLETLQDAARIRYEDNKRSRSRNMLTQNAARTSEWVDDIPTPTLTSNSSRSKEVVQPVVPQRNNLGTNRSASNSTASSVDAIPYQSSSSSLHIPSPNPRARTTSAQAASRPPLHNGTFAPPASSLSRAVNATHASDKHSKQVVDRMRERDADAMEKYMNRTRSGSASTDTKSQTGSAFSSTGPPPNTDELRQMQTFSKSGATTPRRLRSSASASQLKIDSTLASQYAVGHHINGNGEVRTRSGTNPSVSRPSLGHNGSAGAPDSARLLHQSVFEEPGNYTGPPSQYATFPDPPEPLDQESNTPTVNTRRIGFHLLSSKPSLDSSLLDRSVHRRGMSATSLRSG
jgi:hypothetical protein